MGPLEALELRLPEQEYECLKCGKSCGGWGILVDAEARERIEPAQATVALRERRLDPFVVGSDGLLRMSEGAGGRCLYLTERRLCGLQLELGAGAKPRACRQFPFFLIETPDGIQVGLSFRCSSVQQNRGRPLADHTADLEALVRSGRYPRRGFGTIRLDRKRSLDWQGYLKLERQVLEGLDAGTGEGLWRSCVQAAGHAPGALPPELFLQESVSLLVAQLEAEDPEGVEELARRLRSGAGFRSRRFAGEMEGIGSGGPAPVWLEPEIARYLRHLVVRKFLLAGPSVLGRLTGLVLLAPAVRFYVNLFARAGARREVSREDLYRAWDVIEGEVAGHVQGLDDYFQGLEDGLLGSLDRVACD